MTTDINIVTITGRVVKDVEIQSTKGGTSFTRFSIASNFFAGAGKENGVNYIDCIVWGKFAQSISQYLKKGTEVCVSGEFRQERWEKDGVKKSKIGIQAQHIKLCGGKKNLSIDSSPSEQTSGNDDAPF